jgi:hypothetical protein
LLRGVDCRVSRNRPGAVGYPRKLSILCGVAIGYPDPDFPANKLHVGRVPIKENVVFLDS